MAMNKISDCVNQDAEWLQYGNDCLCNRLKTNRENDADLDNILTRLTYMQVYQMINDDFDFIPDYRNNNGTINEIKLHIIVTMNLDNIENNSSLKRVKIVNKTIKILSKYIQKLNNTNPINYINKLRITDEKEYFRELMRAHKWLAELHGVLCTDTNNESDIKIHQEELETSLITAITIQRENDFNDYHLEFLLYKKICKDSQSLYSWERHYKTDGWIQKLPNDSNGNNSDSIFHEKHTCDGVYKFSYINNQFIHQADVNILQFKCWIMTRDVNITPEDCIQKALSHWVVTSEDRVRNLQAHDLYSMYFVSENYRIVKRAENYGMFSEEI